MIMHSAKVNINFVFFNLSPSSRSSPWWCLAPVQSKTSFTMDSCKLTIPSHMVAMESKQSIGTSPTRCHLTIEDIVEQ